MKSRLALFSLLWIASWILAGPPLTDSQRLRTAAAFELVAGVVVDPTTNAIFLMGVNGQVEALSAVNGNLLWRAQNAAKPVGFYGDWVLAQVDTGGNNLSLVRLDAAQGTVVEQGLTISLPVEVFIHIDDGLGRRFSTRSHFIDDGFYLDWDYQVRVVQGIARRDGVVPLNTFSGTFSIDFDQNQATPTGSGTLPLDSAAVLPQTVTQWLAANRPSIPPRRVGNLFATTHISGVIPQIRTVLKRWQADTGLALLDVILHDKPHILQFASGDDRDVLITERTSLGASPEYQWEFFSLETGESRGRIQDTFSLGEFFIAGDLIIVVTPAYSRIENGQIVDYPRRLRAIRLNTSALVWDHPFRDTQFRGPYPP